MLTLALSLTDMAKGEDSMKKMVYDTGVRKETICEVISKWAMHGLLETVDDNTICGRYIQVLNHVDDINRLSLLRHSSPIYINLLIANSKSRISVWLTIRVLYDDCWKTVRSMCVSWYTGRMFVCGPQRVYRSRRVASNFVQ